MRRLPLTTAVAVGLFALACTDARQEGPTEPPSTAAAAKPCTGTLDDIQSQICGLFRPTDNLKSAWDFYNNLQTKLRQGREGEAQAKTFDLVNFTFKQFYAGKLLDPNSGSSPTTWEAVVILTCDVLDKVGDDCGDLASLPPSSPTTHATTQVCGPAGCLVLPEDKHSGVNIPAGACVSTCIISVNPIPATSPRQGPLQTDLDQYLLFRDFTLVADFDVFAVPVIVGICHLDPGDGDFAPPDAATEQRLRLAHPHPTTPEAIEILEKVNAPFLDCSDFDQFNDEVPSFTEEGASLMQRRLGSASRAFGRALVPILQSLLPEPAEATVVGGCCLGGATTKFTSWAAVDPASGTATSTSLSSGTSLATVGTPLTLTATVSPVPSTGESPLVEFFDGSTSLGTAPSNSDGVATLSTSSLTLAQHSLTAKFLGTTSFVESSSAAVIQNMVQRFNDLTSFSAALGEASSATENFNSLAVGTPITSIISGVLNVASPFPSLEVWTDNSLFGFGGTIREDGDGRYDLTFVAPLTKNALAFDVVAKDPATGPAQVVVSAGGGSASFEVHNFATENDPVFLGFIASVPIATVGVIEGPEVGGTGNEETSLDNFVVAAVTLPLPPIILLQ